MHFASPESISHWKRRDSQKGLGMINKQQLQSYFFSVAAFCNPFFFGFGGSTTRS